MPTFDLDEDTCTWRDFFDTVRDVRVGTGDDFRVYLAGDWSNSSVPTPVLLFLHGAGYNALTWCYVTRHLLHLCDCRVAAVVRRASTSRTSLAGAQSDSLHCSCRTFEATAPL